MGSADAPAAQGAGKVSQMAAAAQASTKFEIAGEWVFSVETKSTTFQLSTNYQFTCVILN